MSHFLLLPNWIKCNFNQLWSVLQQNFTYHSFWSIWSEHLNNWNGKVTISNRRKVDEENRVFRMGSVKNETERGEERKGKKRRVASVAQLPSSSFFHLTSTSLHFSLKNIYPTIFAFLELFMILKQRLSIISLESEFGIVFQKSTRKLKMSHFPLWLLISLITLSSSIATHTNLNCNQLSRSVMGKRQWWDVRPTHLFSSPSHVLWPPLGNRFRARIRLVSSFLTIQFVFDLPGERLGEGRRS